jgi:integrase
LLVKRGKVWHLKIKFNGQTIRRSTYTDDKKLARKIEIKVMNALVENKWFHRDPAETTLFRDVWEKYLREEARYKAEKTYSRFIQCAKNFLPEVGHLTLTEITSSILSTYKAKRLEDGVTLCTVVKELQCIRRVFSLCKREWQLARQSPFEFFRMPAVKDQRVRFLEAGQFDRLLQQCPSWLKPIVTLARYTGMRRGNILNLTWSQLDLDTRVINLEYTKNGQRLTLPLTDTAYIVLVAMKKTKVIRLGCPFVFHQNGKPYSPNQVSMAFRRVCRRAGINNFRFHDLRHDFASNLVQSGEDLYIVQQLLGHKDSRMTQRYAHLKIENLREAVKSLERGHKKGHSENEKEVTACVTP